MEENESTDQGPQLNRRSLRRLYPAVFATPRRPLRIGILNDILAAHPGQISRRTLFAFLAAPTADPRYLAALATGGPRYALDGSASGEVSEAERSNAQERLEWLRSQRDALHEQRKARSQLLKAFEASGLTRRQYAESKDLSLIQLNVDLDRGEAERAKRHAERLRLVEAWKSSGLSPEAFAARAKIPLNKIQRAVAWAES